MRSRIQYILASGVLGAALCALNSAALIDGDWLTSVDFGARQTFAQDDDPFGDDSEEEDPFAVPDEDDSSNDSFADEPTVDEDDDAESPFSDDPRADTLADVLEFCGGPSAEIRKVLLDGVMMGHSIDDMSLGITKMNNAVLCFDEVFARPLRETACINCARCLDACPSGLMPGLITKALDRGDMEAVREGGAERCISCGLCSYVCPARRRNSFRMKQAKAMLAAGERS